MAAKGSTKTGWRRTCWLSPASSASTPNSSILTRLFQQRGSAKGAQQRRLDGCCRESDFGRRIHADRAVALQVASGVRNLEQAKSIVNALPPTELSRRNREALRQMRVPDPSPTGFSRTACFPRGTRR